MLYLSQVDPDSIVNPADYFRQLGESLPAMQAANLHIQERIQEVRAHPPTMDQDVTIVPGGRSFEPYVCMFVGEGVCSEESRSMEDYSARFNPQSVSQEAMRGSARLVGTTLVLPYNHVPHSSLGSEHEEDMDETMYGIPRDLAPYRQTVSGTNTLTIQTLEAARSVRNQIDQLTAVADALDETYTLLNSLQATSLKMAEARRSPENTRAVYRWRRWFNSTRSSYANHTGHHGLSQACLFQLSL